MTQKKLARNYRKMMPRQINVLSRIKGLARVYRKL